jgi:hypothetical protein
MKTGIVKSLTLVAMVLVGLTACNDREKEKKIAEMESKLRKEAESKKAVVEFETTTHDFGTIKEGDSAVYTYNFKNTGEVPLIITSVAPSCGCTVPEYSKEPVPAGESGYVKVKFDTNHKKDLVTKTVTVVANTEPKQTTLKFTANIIPKAGQ